MQVSGAGMADDAFVQLCMKETCPLTARQPCGHLLLLKGKVNEVSWCLLGGNALKCSAPNRLRCTSGRKSCGEGPCLRPCELQALGGHCLLVGGTGL